MQEKDLVQQRFSRQYSVYDSVAVIQKQMADKLVETLLRYNDKTCPSVFEIGCGTGLVTKLMHEKFQMNHFLATDLIPEGELTIKNIFQDAPYKAEFEQSDINNYKGINFSADIVVSGACFQWCKDLSNFISKIESDITPNGYLAFSTFGPNNFKEITNVSGASLEYLSIFDLKKILNPYFEIKHMESNETQMLFNTPLEVLQHIKKTGVNALQRTTWTKSKLNSFISKYSEKFKLNEKFKLTYEPIIIVARKK